MKEFTTNDLSFAAYLTMHGITPISAKRLGKSFKFTFEDTPEVHKLRFSFVGSESSKFDDAVRKIKRLVFGDRGE